MALVKGTPDYKKAQKLANAFCDDAFYSRSNILGGEFAWEVLCEARKLEGFAKEVAKTIEEKHHKYNVYYVSDKQAWIIACALIEQKLY